MQEGHGAGPTQAGVLITVQGNWQEDPEPRHMAAERRTQHAKLLGGGQAGEGPKAPKG